MRRVKTGYKRLVLNDFTGGLNTEKSEFDIADNEFKVFQNVVLDFGGTRLRGGFQIEYGFLKPVLSAFQREDDMYLIFEDGEFGVYNTSAKSYTSKGTITDPISIIPKMVWFNPIIVLTVGDSVWVYDTVADTLTKTSSPVAKDLLVKYGRVAIASGDEVWFSRVGDATDWTPDSNDPASAQYFQIGYKEGKDITAINHFLDDILVFKEDRIYQLTGMSSVKLLNSKRGAINNSSTISLMSDVYAIDKNGFYSVVKDRFVDVVAGDLDLKVKSFFKENIDTNIRIFYSPVLRAFIIKGKNETFLYFYEYGSFSTFKTKLPIDIYVDDGRLYGLKEKAYVYKKETPYDSFSNYIADVNQEISTSNYYIYQIEKIQGVIKTKTFTPAVRQNIIRIGFSIKGLNGKGSLNVKAGKKQVSYSITPSATYIYDARTEISSSNNVIYGLPRFFSRHFHCNQIVDSFDFYISFDAPVSIPQVFLDYVPMEV